MKVLYFAKLRDDLGCAEETIALPPEVTSVAGLRAHLMARGSVWQQALAPENELASSLPDQLETALRHSAAARISGRVPRAGTQVSASYKWLSGTALSRQDVFGESALGIDPHLSLAVRQPLPSFGSSGRWEALADFRNVLSQGYVPMDVSEGRLLLAPVVRSFRGGVSFQF